MIDITPQDGTSLGLFLDALTLGKVLGGQGEFDPVKLTWIGRIVSTATVSVVWHTSPVQTIEEAKKREILMAGTVPSNTSNFIPAALNDLIGTKIKVIMGFRGSPDQALAMLRGEVNSIGGMSWEAIQTNHQDWLTEKKIRVLYTQGANRIKELPDVPGLLDFAYDERSRSLLGLLGSGPDIGRSLVAEPGIPPERAAALRKAFMATMRDPELIAEIKKRRLDLEPLSGEEVQKMVAGVRSRRQRRWSSRPSAISDNRSRGTSRHEPPVAGLRSPLSLPARTPIAQAQRSARDKLRYGQIVGSVKSVSSLALYTAQRKGFLARENIDLEVDPAARRAPHDRGARQEHRRREPHRHALSDRGRAEGLGHGRRSSAAPPTPSSA